MDSVRRPTGPGPRRGHQLNRRDFLRLGGGGLIGGVVLAGCGGGEPSSTGGRRAVIRFAFAPDPVWDYMNDNGIIVQYEDKYDMRIVTSSTWDEFTFFAGGHGDLVSMATYETPVLEKETKLKTVTFGKYNHLRITPLKRADSPYQTLADIPKGSKIGVPSAVSSTLLWGMFAKKLHNLDFRVGGGDFKLVVEDHFVMPELVVRKQLEAALAIPEAAVPFLRKGQLEVMYGGKAPWEIYQQISPNPKHKGVMGNNFTATAKWFDGHKEQAAAFLALWERGVKEWRANQDKIISTYPQHFSVEDDEDVAYIKDYMSKHDWFVDSVYLTDDWIKSETALYGLMKETGFMDQDAPIPRYEVVAPPAGG
ncbi:MAG TPA: ABC transporter substrate-binding protein [Actinomycetes bacterium]|nr:ABC transporter substrate-binding protein [Actinomycetes bacterium]